MSKKSKDVQRWDKEWTLGCVNPASWLSLAAGGEFTQPRVHSLAHPCTIENIVALAATTSA